MFNVNKGKKKINAEILTHGDRTPERNIYENFDEGFDISNYEPLSYDH